MSKSITINYDDTKHKLVNSSILENNWQYIKISGGQYARHGLDLDTYDLYMVPQNNTMFTSFVDLMETFSLASLPNSPNFNRTYYGEDLYINKSTIKHKAYLAPKYSFLPDSTLPKILESQRIFYYYNYRKWSQERKETTGAAFAIDFIQWLSNSRSIQGVENKVHPVIESLLDMVRVISLMKLDFTIRFDHRSLRVDETGNIIFFDIFRSY